ncbi:hypothetical protein Tco_0731444 [Tanacetum coccineum]
MEEVSLTIDEAKLRKMTDEMLRQRCTLGDEHQYYIDQMQNFLKSDIVWESRKEILKGNSGPEKIVLSLHKFPAIIFNDDDIEEQTSRWVNKSTVIWERVHDFQLGIESYQQKVNLTAPSMTFPRIKDHEIVLEGLKSYNNDVKYGYVQKDVTKEEAEHLKLFEEETEERLKYRRQMRKWEMFVNGRPLGPRRERPE